MKNRLTKTIHGKGYWALLALACLACYGCICTILFAVGREPMWGQDCIPLYLSSFEYEGLALREAVMSLFGAGSGQSYFPYTFNMGYGADTYLATIGTLQDPLNLVAALVPRKYAEYVFIALVPVHLILAAFSFSFYCLRKGNPRRASFVASLAYVFSGFMLYLALFKHVTFLPTTIFLPLILAGADDVFSGRRHWLFIAAFAGQLFISVYFAYMSGLLLLIYCVVRYFLAPRKRGFADFCWLVARFVGCIAFAFCLAAVAALPNATHLFSMERVGVQHEVPLFDTVASYFTYPARFLGGVSGSSTMYVGAVGVLACIVFIACGRLFPAEQRRPWLVGLVVLLVCLVFNYAGSVFNGFSYASNRWLYGLGFCVAYIVCLTIPKLGQLERRDWRRVLVVAGVFAAASLAPVLFSSKHVPTYAGVATLVVVTSVCLFLARRKGGRHLGVVLSVCVCACSVLAFTLYCSSYGSSYYQQLESVGGARKTLTTNNSLQVMKEVDDDGVYRVSRPSRYDLRNSGLLIGVKGIDFFNSYYNQAVDTWQRELGVSEKAENYIFAGAQSRLAMDLLGGAKYFVAKKGESSWLIPQGYESTGVSNSGYAVYRNDDALPLAFTADKVISRDDYLELGMVEKQEALLQGCVLDGVKGATGTEAGTASGLPAGCEAISPAPTSQAVDYTATTKGDIELNGDKVSVYSDKATLTLSFEGLPNSETYVCFQDLDLQAFSPAELRQHSGADANDWATFKSNASWSAPKTFTVSLQAGERKRSISQATPYGNAYGGKDDWAVNFGYSEEPLTTVTISFSTKGTYSFSDLSVVCQPVEPLVKSARTLDTGHLRDLQIEGASVSATVNAADAPQLAVFTVPYSRGWTAIIDGEPAEIRRADTAFMAVEVPGGGERKVELHYATPGFLPGLALTLGSAATFAVVLFAVRRRSKHTA